MSFLSPVYLLLAAAAAVPLLIHLMRRRIGTRVELPSARYLARAEQEHSRKLRLRNLLLMLLRVLAVLFIAAAAARPVGSVAGTGHAPTALAIVLDNSLSTTVVIDGAPLFDRLRRAASDAARAAGPADRLWLVTADGRVSGGSASAVAAAIDRTTPLAGAGDLQEALLRASGLARGAGLAERQVALVTDGQATSWARPTQLGDVGLVALAPALAPPANRAVLAADARPSRWTPRGALTARFLVPGDSVSYRVALAGRTLARGTVGAPAGGGDANVAVQAAPADRGWVAGTVELEPDELPGDDVRWFALWIGASPAITVDPATGPFVATAATALAQSGRARLGGSDAVALVSAENLERLPALVVAPTDPVRIGAANRALERAGVPWRFGPARRADATVRGGAALTSTLGGISASLRYALVRQPSDAPADTLASAGADPWIVAGDRYVIVASPLVAEATSLPVRAPFVPLLDELVAQRLAGSAGPVLAAAPGATVPAPPAVDGLQGASPESPRLPLSGATLSAPTRPGVYFFMRGTERAGALVVNAEEEESLLQRLRGTELASRLRARRVNVLEAAGEWPAAVFASSTRRPLTVPLLVAALVLLAVETLLTRSTGARAGRASSAPARAAA